MAGRGLNAVDAETFGVVDLWGPLARAGGQSPLSTEVIDKVACVRAEEITDQPPRPATTSFDVGPDCSRPNDRATNERLSLTSVCVRYLCQSFRSGAVRIVTGP